MLWTRLANSPDNTAGAMWLIQDGTILVYVGGADGLTLKSLHPDSKGSYANGSWSDAGKFLLARDNFASAVLPDGRLVVCGGEQSGPGLPTNETKRCEIYDPLTKSSKEFQPPTGWTNIGDSPSVVLPNGTFMLGNTQGQGSQVALLDAATLTWTFGGGDNDNEQGYVLLQNGGVLTANVYNQTSMRYDPSVKAFVQDASLPVMLGAGSEIGPGICLIDGRVIWFGASGHTCLYTPGATGHNGSWIQGPDLPTMADGTQLVCNDTSAILEPNGKVLVVTWWGTARAGAGIVVFLEYDPVKNKFIVLDGAPKTANREATKMLLLPNGHGLVSISSLATGDDNGLYDTMFDSGAQPSWAPTISCFPPTAARNQTVTLIGTQLCGLSECQHFGDDNQQAENYPMVRFIDGGGGVTYARAHDVNTRSIAPKQPGSVLVDIPGSLAIGTYSVEAVAMGLPSSRATVNVVARSLKFGVIMVPANQPYEWWWGLTGDEVGQKLQASRMQLRNISAYVDLDNTVKFTAIMEPPTGESWWWYWGLSGQDLGAKLTANNARLTDLCPYVAPDGSLRFVAIMVGVSGKTWWWYWGQTADQIASLLQQHHAVLTKISPYWDHGSLRFAVVMEPNVGQTWWWYWGQTGQDVGAILAKNKAELTDIAAYVDQADNLRFAVLMAAPTSAYWWWWGLEACGISQKLSASNARPTVLTPYFR
jgi:hypothetical protein